LVPVISLIQRLPPGGVVPGELADVIRPGDQENDDLSTGAE